MVTLSMIPVPPPSGSKATMAFIDYLVLLRSDVKSKESPLRARFYFESFFLRVHEFTISSVNGLLQKFQGIFQGR